MCGVLGVEGVARDHRIEVGLPTVGLGAQQSPEALRFFLARAEGSRNLHGNRRLRKIDGEVGDLGHHQGADLATPERVEQRLAFGVLGGALDHGGIQFGAQFVQLIQVRADHQCRRAGVAGQDRFHHVDFGMGRGTELVALIGLGGRVDHPLVVGERDAHLDAFGGGDPALCLNVFPWCVIALGSNEAEHVALTAVLPDEGGGEAEAAP
ncbi:Uncharacterised protein [Mycobacteroides abscessus subsp. abscessus]|nr:Uncharacterised protein [Mycobacteroides abscessus subsp. abscessus]